MRLHVADLHRRGVRAQQRPHVVGAPDLALDRRRQIQRVLHVARGMLGRHVQRVEAVPLVLDLGAFDDGEAHAREDLFHPLAHDGQRMAVAERGGAAGQRDVDGAGRARGCARPRSLIVGPARLDRLLQLVGVAADAPSSGRAGRCAISCIQDGDDAVLAAEIAVADGLRVARRGAPARARPRTRRAVRDRRRLSGRSVIGGDSQVTKARSPKSRSRICQASMSATRSARSLRRLRRGAAVFAALFACSASVANAAGLAIASSDRLLRSSVTPAFFRPLMN